MLGWILSYKVIISDICPRQMFQDKVDWGSSNSFIYMDFCLWLELAPRRGCVEADSGISTFQDLAEMSLIPLEHHSTSSAEARHLVLSPSIVTVLFSSGDLLPFLNPWNGPGPS